MGRNSRKNAYDTEEAVSLYFKQLRRLEVIKEICVAHSHRQMLLLKKAENFKSEIAFWKSFQLPEKVYTKNSYDENRNLISTKYIQFQHEELNRVNIDKKISMLELEISKIQAQINQINSETFVEVFDRV